MFCFPWLLSCNDHHIQYVSLKIGAVGQRVCIAQVCGIVFHNLSWPSQSLPNDPLYTTNILSSPSNHFGLTVIHISNHLTNPIQQSPHQQTHHSTVRISASATYFSHQPAPSIVSLGTAPLWKGIGSLSRGWGEEGSGGLETTKLLKVS